MRGFLFSFPAVAFILAFASLLNVALTSRSDVNILINEAARLSNQSLLWGPYRPNLYFGVRPRIPKSFLSGLLWAKVDNFATVQNNFRHTCEQHEGMAGYGWEEYDVRTGGRQTIHDAENNIDLTVDFIKAPGGSHGGSWGARIKGQPREDAPTPLITTLVFYAGMEGLGSLDIANEQDELGYEGSVRIYGQSMELGEFKIEIMEGPGSNRFPPRSHESYDDKPLDRTMVSSIQVPEEALWQAKNVLFSDMKKTIDEYMEKYGQEQMPPPWQTFTISNSIKPANLQLVQKVFTGAFEFDILFSSGSEVPFTSELLSQGIKVAAESFSERFARTLAPRSPFDTPHFEKFSKAMLSNLVGGIGYFYGDSIVDKSYAPEYDEENEGFWEETAEARMRAELKRAQPVELFTSTPSRPFFPRGFLWDEGFHLIPIADWDMDLTLEIVKSWFNLMDEDGWIAREQILGPEARSKVPQEFQTQLPVFANPPTLYMILENFISKLPSNLSSEVESLHQGADLRSTHLKNPELALGYLRDLYPLLKRQYIWFRKTQWGDIKSYDREAFSRREAYRWRGRTIRHILTSGLDDYPRPQPPHPGELHTDLISWMGMMTRSLRRIAEALGESEDASDFRANEEAIIRNIEDLHWNEKAKTFCDATIDEYEESVHVCHKGYISIFPFMTGLLATDSARLKPILDLISDPEELWSDFGIRSLSKRDEFYGTDENYWRSPIWINMNYLVIKNLLDVAKTDGPCRKQATQIYIKLRKNLVENVFREWERTGFAWEQYNPETGEGQRTQHFTGWTSLVVKIMVMPDLSKEGVGHDEL